jgi:hypothetical protein
MNDVYARCHTSKYKDIQAESVCDSLVTNSAMIDMANDCVVDKLYHQQEPYQ